MDELLRCIPSELEEETDYPDLSGKKRKGRIPPAKATKASQSVAECRPMTRIKAVDEFKMKKFLNVQSKVKCYMWLLRMLTFWFCWVVRFMDI